MAARVGTSKTRGEQGSTISVKAAVQPGHWLRTLIYNNNNNNLLVRRIESGFGGLEDACWPLVPKFGGSIPAEVVGFFRAKKLLSKRSLGGEVKPAVSCRKFTACKRSLNVTWKSAFRQNFRLLFITH
jgi:hypothetical protein